MMKFSHITQTMTYHDLISHVNKSFSPSDYRKININCKTKKIIEIVDGLFKGNEVGSKSYLGTNTDYIFIRTKSIKKYNNLLEIDNNEVAFLSKKIFEDKQKYLLLKDAILYTTGGEVGEVCISEDNIKGIISSHIIQIIIKNRELRYYIFGILKSDFAKELITLSTPTGSIKGLDNFKKEYLENLTLPIPYDKNMIKKISILTQSMIKKETELKKKFFQINLLIKQELQHNQLSNTFNYQMPSFSDISIHNRLDTGLYTEEFKQIEFLIINYKNGYYYLDEKDLKSGATPKENDRVFNSGDINWITPTNINDYGAMYKIPKIAIRSKKYNISKNCILFINRTSKGNKGEYVGISHFYNYDILGKGQHNQGLYRLENQSKTKLLFLTSFMNSKLVRKLCSNISMGSKMKEMKSLDFEKLPIPLFPKDKQKNIAKLYYNQNDNYLTHIVNFDIENYVTLDEKVTRDSGTLDLDEQIKTIRSIIDTEIKKMVG